MNDLAARISSNLQNGLMAMLL